MSGIVARLLVIVVAGFATLNGSESVPAQNIQGRQSRNPLHENNAIDTAATRESGVGIVALRAKRDEAAQRLRARLHELMYEDELAVQLSKQLHDSQERFEALRERDDQLKALLLNEGSAIQRSLLQDESIRKHFDQMKRNEQKYRKRLRKVIAAGQDRDSRSRLQTELQLAEDACVAAIRKYEDACRSAASKLPEARKLLADLRTAEMQSEAARNEVLRLQARLRSIAAKHLSGPVCSPLKAALENVDEQLREAVRAKKTQERR